MPYSERVRFTSATDQSQPVNAVPDCPFCRSPRVTTTSKTISDETYWRCLACGDIWNPARQAAGRQSFIRPRY